MVFVRLMCRALVNKTSCESPAAWGAQEALFRRPTSRCGPRLSSAEPTVSDPKKTTATMSVGQAFADIPIIDVTTGEDTTLAAVIGNGAHTHRELPAVWPTRPAS